MTTTSVRYSENLLRNLDKSNIKPIIVMEIDGVPFLIGSDVINKFARYGDEGLDYGNEGLVYGGFTAISNQKALISLEGTTTNIKQELQPDKARGSSISSMNVVLTDLDKEATKIATGTYGEMLFKDVKVWVGFSDESSFNEDYILIFRGLIEKITIEQASVKLSLASPDQKRRQTLAPKSDTQLDGAISNVQTAITVSSVDNFIEIPTSIGSGLTDDSLKTYFRIDDEIIEYTGISGLIFTGCVRGSLSTVAAAHDNESSVEAFLKLEGNIFDLALKIMLSDKDETPYIEDLQASSVNDVNGQTVNNSIFFNGVDLQRDYNVRVGDYVVTSGFFEGANNIITYTKILGITILDAGSFIIIDSTLVLEPSTTGLVTFLSQYNTFGDFGLKMNTDEIDIERYLFLRDNFLLDADVRVYIRDEIDEAKEFIELELFKPFACYSLPSDKRGLSRLSVGYHIGPLPIEQIITLDKTNIKNPDKLKMDRSINKFHYNVVGFAYNDTPLDDVLRKKNFQVVGTPTIPTGNKTLKIESLGLRDDLGADTQVIRAASRLLKRYKDAAEFYPSVEVLFSAGVTVNIGDIVVFDPTGLNLPNRADQTRDKSPLLMEVLNKSTNIKNGMTTVALIDTNADINQRLGLFSPASKIVRAITQTQFKIAHPIGAEFSGYGINDGQKWQNHEQSIIEIHNADFSDSATAKLNVVSGNIITIDVAPGFMVTDNDYFIKLADYSLQPDNINLIFAFASDGSNPFADTKVPYTIL